MAAPRGYRCVFVSMLLLCLLGVMLSVYAYYVETTKEKDPSFKAACDISPGMSCSKVFTSKYGRGFGLLEYIVGRKHWLNQPNSVFGVAFYIIQIFLTFNQSVSSATAQIVCAIIANMGSVYLAYILYFVLNDFCIICVSTYIINFFVLLAIIAKYRILSSRLSRRSKKAK